MSTRNHRHPRLWERRFRRCGHPHCTACATKRGRNRGNRRARAAAKTAIRAGAA